MRFFFNNTEFYRVKDTFKYYYKRQGWDISLLLFTFGQNFSTSDRRLWLSKFCEDFADFTDLLFILAINILLTRKILSNMILIFRILSLSTYLYYIMCFHQHHVDKWKIAQWFYSHKGNLIYFLIILKLRSDFIYYIF